MFGAYRGGSITINQLRSVYERAVQNVRNGKYLSIGPTFEAACQGSAPVELRLESVDTPRPLRGDIVVFGDASRHACIATGKVVPRTTGNVAQVEHEVISLWIGNRGRVERTTIEALAKGALGRPILFWSAKWG